MEWYPILSLRLGVEREAVLMIIVTTMVGDDCIDDVDVAFADYFGNCMEKMCQMSPFDAVERL